MRRLYREICEKIGKEQGISPYLLEAVIWKESGGDRFAIRYESHWRWFLHPIKYAKLVRTTEKTERIGQSISWGLMQVMGAVCREVGYRGPFPKLCDPQVGILYGAIKLGSLLKKHGNARDALSAYNTGRPASKTKTGRMYADSVLSQMDKISSDRQG